MRSNENEKTVRAPVVASSSSASTTSSSDAAPVPVRDLSSDVERMLKLVNSGDPNNPMVVDAQARLGDAYYLGEIVKEDRKEGARLLKLASKRQDLPAGIWAMGRCHQFCIGAVKSYSMAADYYKKAMNLKYALAENTLAWCYKYGQGVPRIPKNAAILYYRAARQGLAAAQCSFGLCAKLGEGIAKDLPMAARFFRVAADQGYPTAQRQLGMCYEQGIGVLKNEKEAFRWYLLAAQAKGAEGTVMGARYSLGCFYRDGKGVKKDLHEAVRWLGLASEQGHSWAQEALKKIEESETKSEKEETAEAATLSM